MHDAGHTSGLPLLCCSHMHIRILILLPPVCLVLLAGYGLEQSLLRSTETYAEGGLDRRYAVDGRNSIGLRPRRTSDQRPRKLPAGVFMALTPSHGHNRLCRLHAMMMPHPRLSQQL